mgnify:CR=1 FL=1
MKKAIYIRFLIIIFITVMLSGMISAIFAAVNEEKQVRENASHMCKAVSYQYSTNSDAAYLSDVLEGMRITIIAPDGTVLDD